MNRMTDLLCINDRLILLLMNDQRQCEWEIIIINRKWLVILLLLFRLLLVILMWREENY